MILGFNTFQSDYELAFALALRMHGSADPVIVFGIFDRLRAERGAPPQRIRVHHAGVTHECREMPDNAAFECIRCGVHVDWMYAAKNRMHTEATCEAKP